jgi:hypothetical protein
MKTVLQNRMIPDQMATEEPASTLITRPRIGRAQARYANQYIMPLR